MNILLDLVHPADILFYRHAIEIWREGGHEVVIASREKDVLVPMLDEFGLEHQPLTRAGQGWLGLGRELLVRDYRLLRLAREVEADVITGFGGVAPSHVGKLLGIPSIAFYDTEWAGLQMRLTLPFIGEWHVPESWEGPAPEQKTFRFAGGKQFAYLHPDHFSPSLSVAKKAGWEEGRDNFLVRIVAWQASHDAGREGLGLDRLREIVDCLAARGRVHLSAEGSLPPDLEAWRYRGTPVQFHHLLGHCRACVGESITVASEAAMLGVPSLVQIDKDYGYLTEQQEAELIFRIAPGAAIAPCLEDLLSIDRQAYRERSRAHAASKGDLNSYIAENVLRVAKRQGR